MKHVTKIELPKENGKQNNGKDNKLLTSNFEVKMQNQKVEELISYFHLSNKLSNPRLILEVTKNYGEFMLILNQIKTNGQSMVFYNTWVSMIQQRIQML